MSSFLEGVDLSNAAELAIRRDLELRRKDPRVADRFYRYHYQGGADMCLREGTYFPGRVRPEKYAELVGEAGKCYGNSLRACWRDDHLVYVEGYCTTSAGLPFSHGWCIERGTTNVVDLTLPCGEDQLDRYLHSKTRLPILHPSKWAYFGVTFSTELVMDHDHHIGLPMLDRSFAEGHEASLRPNPDDYAEPHDNPILKRPYDHTRTSLEGIPYENPYQHPDKEEDDDDE